MNINEMISYTEKGITSKVIHKDANTDVTLFCMAANTSMDEHTSTKSGIIYVIEGKGIFNLEGKAIEMIPGVFFAMKKNAVHSLSAQKNTAFLLVLSK